ncbi:MAG: TIR domain-containing protein [Desulforhopalus sp.]|nr:TIR domain-containing protein [Desulforhopalus sp.]
MPRASKDRVFLSYAHQNLDMVRQIYVGLKERKIDVWFDKEDLGPGLWKRSIGNVLCLEAQIFICYISRP